MKNLIWHIQKSFFQILNTNEKLVNLKVMTYSSIASNAKFPYILISFIKDFGDDVFNKKKQAEIKISIFDNCESIKNISNIIDIIQDCINIDALNVNQENGINFVSLEKQSCEISNNIQYNSTCGLISYNIIYEVLE